MSALSATFLRARNRKMYILRSAMLTHGARRAARLAGLLKKLPIVDASSDPAGNFLQAGEAALFTDDKNDPLTLRTCQSTRCVTSRQLHNQLGEKRKRNSQRRSRRRAAQGPAVEWTSPPGVLLRISESSFIWN
jgi:hypothetical protein